MSRPPLARLLFVLLLAALFLAGVRLLLPGSWGEEALRRVGGLGGFGAPALAAMFLVVCVFALPGLPLTLGGGFFFGFAGGFLTVMAGTVFGTAVAFALGRTVARPRVVAWGAKRPDMVALDRAVGRRGFLLVLLTRVSPFFPYNLLTYAYSITRVPFRTFLAGSAIGVAPVTAFYVYVGTVMKSLADVAAGRMDASDLGLAAPVAAGAATLLALAFIGRVAKGEVERAIEEEGAPPS